MHPYITYDEACKLAMKFDKHNKNNKAAASYEKGGSSKFKSSYMGGKQGAITPNTRSKKGDKGKKVTDTIGYLSKIKCLKCQGQEP